MTLRKSDCIEFYPVYRGRNKRRALMGWRFRFFLADTIASMLVSNGLYESQDEARRVADVVNATCYHNGFKPRKKASKA